MKIQASVNNSEYHHVKTMANIMGMTVSDYIRSGLGLPATRQINHKKRGKR